MKETTLDFTNSMPEKGRERLKGVPRTKSDAKKARRRVKTKAPLRRAGTASQLLETRPKLKEPTLKFKKSMPENIGTDTKAASRATGPKQGPQGLAREQARGPPRQSSAKEDDPVDR